jgi:hypothetical protein
VHFTVTSARLAERLLTLGRYEGPVDDTLIRSACGSVSRMSLSFTGWSKLVFLVVNDTADDAAWRQADPLGEAGQDGCRLLVSPALIEARTTRA